MSQESLEQMVTNKQGISEDFGELKTQVSARVRNALTAQAGEVGESV